VWPGLTTVRQPFEVVAQALVDLLVDRLENPESAPGSSMLVPRLVIRGSTAGSDR
jgi:DNA-binding LacI/PurR family transcriptional regulator